MIRPLWPAVAVVSALVLAACDTPAPDEQEQALAQSEQRAAEAAQPAAAEAAPADAASCDPLQAQWTVGKPVADADAEQARKDAGATRVRILKPGQPITLEFDAARLDIEVDENGVGVSVRCG
ncbi:MAG: I78 family peptidase inhibitor [Pseudoxanthomonas sp.]